MNVLTNQEQFIESISREIKAAELHSKELRGRQLLHRLHFTSVEVHLKIRSSENE